MTSRKDYLDNLIIKYLNNRNLEIAVSDSKNYTTEEFKNKVIQYKLRLEKIWGAENKKKSRRNVIRAVFSFQIPSTLHPNVSPVYEGTKSV